MKKNINLITGLTLSLFLSVADSNTTFAQGKGNSKKETTLTEDQENQAEKQRGRSEQARENKQRGNNANQNETAVQKQEEGRNKFNNGRGNVNNNRKNDRELKEDNDNKGNAYGKNKGDLSGRGFGQNRAANARLTNEERKAELAVAVNEGDKKVKEARTKIDRAKNDLEKDRKNKKINDEQYRQKKAKIVAAENAVNVLEDKVNEGREINAAE